ncbi:Tyrosine-protein phosphatase non-receptor type ptp-2 [Caenorhabditis elegans]|uniref:Tyrosine-protein phosphatase non-receptor type ptp-2 n=1 Tax=Caenorhabditis elegans TaxID=6239 RepID=PTP2_CAEEL|nr:Tyrosine-protein phosphatase non-receptor type ptp-2 [Caenorhabditis elegans]G5EC24.1 RecName: Full=Tyrosine-protein phosphatase non-receptor type ptp-2; AltName: Full=Protein-tyrosine phosphatase 2 [Caenorhabditis elegans]AAC21678.1 protein tyrosine phosphatase [Caenorhabditis elegans]CCD70155.1 Tyrosine-protein phosphatase non-receptor type ptp-2 [Caenorhabditis elegans]|eukprot:NP_001293512.1 Tyrosine-protein phosphatase non-receptor type ptp-2 [Caenorhabditis elegans]
MPRLALRQYNFYYRVNGEKAEELLKEYGEDGDFLLRYSESNPQNFSISVRVAEDKILHIKVTKYESDMLSIFEDERTTPNQFGSITELAEFYMEFPEKLREKNGLFLELKKPVYVPYHLEACAEEQRRTQLYRWWHGNLPASSANKLLQTEKNGTYLLRASQHIPGALVISAKTEGQVVHLTIYQDPSTGRFNIDGDRTKFQSAWLLIDSYSKNPIVEKGEASRVLYLEEPLFNTFIEADLFVDRFEIIRRPINPRESMEKTGISEEFDRLSQEALPAEQYLSKREGRRPVNAEKNRYKNIVPFDHTRVILTDRPNTPGSDYINASYVRFENSQRTKNVTFACEKSFIATQGCLETTISDFWSMVWQENSRVIVMPTMENERKEKCARYWPAEVNKPEVHGDISLTCTIERKVQRAVSDEVKAELEQEKTNRIAKGLVPEAELNGDGISYILRTLVMKKGKDTREIRQLQYLTWPDHGCPLHPYAVLNFLEDVDREYDYFNAQPIAASLPQGPIVVHCSAGIGRTGTVLVLDALLNQVKKVGLLCPMDVYKMVKYVRTYRSGLVQTEQQYQFLYKALAFYLKNNNPYPVKSFIDGDTDAFDFPRRLRPTPNASRPSSARQVTSSRPSSSASSRTSHSRPRTGPQAEPIFERSTSSTSSSSTLLKSTKK